MEPTRDAWGEERIDELAKRTDDNLREIRGEVRELRTELRNEIQEARTELKGDTANLRTEVDARSARLESALRRTVEVLLGALVTGLVGLVVTHFIG
jgi:Sec-independent protein translocase protein TatA